MSTDVTVSEPQGAGLKDFVPALMRRRTPAIITASVCIVVALLFALLLPAEYRSAGTILIEQQEVPVDLVRSTVSEYADQRLQVINQRVMTSENLLGIVRRYDLYPDRQGRDTREELVTRMRKDIDLKMIHADVIDPRSGAPRQATIAFAVSYTSRVPEHAVKVANELVSLYLNENVTERQRLASNATNFLVDESERLSKEIAAVEAKIADFKAKHADAMPELQNLNRTLLDRTEQDLRSMEMRSVSLDQQRVFLEAQLTQVKPDSNLTTDSGERVLSPSERVRILKSRLASARAMYAPDHPDIARMERELRGLEAEVGKSTAAEPSLSDMRRNLDKARGELAQARDRYTPDHPDLQRLERSVSALEAQVKEAEAKGEPAPRTSEGADNPAYIQLQSQLTTTLTEQKAVRTRIDELRAEMRDYERKLAGAPVAEKEYHELLRDYESASNKYREVRAKQMEAQLAQNLETDRKGERFTVIEPPLPPEEPVSPNRPAIMAIGVVLALGVTFALVMLLEKLDSSVRSRADLVSLLEVPPLAVLPWIETSADRLLAKRRQRFAIAGAVASLLVSIALIHVFFRPLDLLWFNVLHRLGAL